MPEGKLVICPTPLGNLGDMTPRAIDALRQADCVCCEDTRVTGKLLAALDVEGVRLERLDEEVLGARAEGIIERVQAGEVICYCTDAGMPGVSDPGQRLIAAARAAGVTVDVLPGPVAATTAYVTSGFICPRFYFGGFFPRKSGEREQVLSFVRTLDAVALFYESPHRIVEALKATAEAMPERSVAVCRELTKLHEEVVVGAATDVAREFAKRAETAEIKGELVLVIDAPSVAEQQQVVEQAQADAASEAQRLLAEGTLSKRDIVAHLQDTFGISRNVAYELVHGA